LILGATKTHNFAIIDKKIRHAANIDTSERIELPQVGEKREGHGLRALSLFLFEPPEKASILRFHKSFFNIADPFKISGIAPR
jgi:hypothetical protein